MPQINLNGALWEITKDNEIVLTTSTPDELIKQNSFSTPSTNPSAFSVIRNLYTRHKNVPAGVTGAVADDQLIVDVRVKWHSRSFTASQIQGALVSATWPFTDATVGLPNLNRFMLGSRSFN